MPRRLAAILLSSVFFLFSLLTPQPASAAITGNLFGNATDSSGSVLPGVTVTIDGPQLQGTRTTVTGDAGDYSFPLLPPGAYTVTFTLDGFEEVVHRANIVALDQATKVSAAMNIGALDETVTVTAASVAVDPTATTVAQNFTAGHLEHAAIGSAGRSYDAVIAQAAGAAGQPNAQVLGASVGQNTYLLDGLNTTDPVTHKTGSTLPFDSIQEISIQLLGKDAEYGRAIGGVVNIVTKSGGNDLSGSFDARFSNNALGGASSEGSEAAFSDLIPALTLGGPIQHDRIWFFTSLQRPQSKSENLAPEGFDYTPGTYSLTGQDMLGKITATLAQNQTASLRYTKNDTRSANSQKSYLFRPEADSRYDRGSTIYNLGYDAVLSNNWLASAQLGRRTGYVNVLPMSGDYDATAVLDLSTGVLSGNFSDVQKSRRNRNELIASTTYLFNGLGSHTLKVGTNLDHSTYASLMNLTGNAPDASMCNEEYGFAPGATCGAVAYSRSGRPYYVTVISDTPEQTFESKLQAFYLQDEWHPIPSLTARLGIRRDAVQFGVPGREHAPNLAKWQPRLGMAWDVFDDGSTIAHGFWGQVMDDNGLTLASYGSTMGSTVSTFVWSNKQQQYVFYDTYGGTSGNSYDPNLRPTYSDEATIGITRRLGRKSSIDVSAVRRTTNDIIEDSCSDQATCATFWMTNGPNSERGLVRSDYTGVITRFESNPTTALHALVSYTWSKSRGSVGYNLNQGGDFDIYPDHFINRYGYLSDDSRHRVKASGFARTPFGTTIGLDYMWESGTPYSITADVPPAGYDVLYVEPRGSRRRPVFQQLDMQVRHDVKAGPLTAGLIFSVYNVMNLQTPTEISGQIGAYEACPNDGTPCIANPMFGQSPDAPESLAITNESFGQATSWQRPRSYEVGIRLVF